MHPVSMTQGFTEPVTTTKRKRDEDEFDIPNSVTVEEPKPTKTVEVKNTQEFESITEERVEELTEDKASKAFIAGSNRVLIDSPALKAQEGKKELTVRL
ncbi:hypothetical protein FRC06_001185 [Ceratobasidium sp. 370]|nr:hypothetical protein FRC06_001185 [Ceratobasidium sp. 370]